ncbi:MAG: phage major capsid protein [Solirubrobacteraceae bacterium]
MPDRPVAGEVEQRTLAEAAPEVDGLKLRGLIPYGVESHDFGGWREIIEPGALTGADLSSLIATREHDRSQLLGRYPTTMEVEDRADGFAWAVELPDSPTGHDARVAVERGDLRSTSWRMRVAKDRWQGNVRHVERIASLHDVCVTAEPAYGSARAELRAAPENPEPTGSPTPPQEAPMPEVPEGGGLLRVGDRTAAATGATPEARILDAIASVARGECRDLTRASAAPVEPDDLRTVLIQHFRERSVVVASGVPIIATDSKAVKWPMLTGDVSVAFYDELEEITESDPTLDDFEVPVKALKALVRMSSEAVEDSDPELLQVVSENINTAMVLKGDRELVAGNDLKGFPGLLNIAGTQSIAVGGALSWDHVIKAVGLLVEGNVPGPFAVLLGARPATALDLTKDADGNYLTRPEGIPPIYMTGWLPVSGGASPTTSAVVYAPGQQLAVIRRQVTVEIDRSQEFSRDAVLARGRYRLGLGVPHPQSIVKLTGITAPAIA